MSFRRAPLAHLVYMLWREFTNTARVEGRPQVLEIRYRTLEVLSLPRVQRLHIIGTVAFGVLGRPSVTFVRCGALHGLIKTSRQTPWTLEGLLGK